jgi:impB/mucB/samB family C-terminal domain
VLVVIHHLCPTSTPCPYLLQLATDSIKPDGCCVVQDYRKLISPLSLRQLPGIGHHLEEKLNESGLSTVKQVWDLGDRACVLEGILGVATGKKIHNFCRGIDDRPVVASERKSIGAECSYGVRFDGEYGPDYMISCLAVEVVKRMNAIGVRGGSKVTLKIKRRKQHAKAPMKFLGHGSCDNLSRSCDVPASSTTADSKVLSDLCFTLYRQLGVPKEDVRGMGIVLTKLTFSVAGASAPADARQQPDLRSWLCTRSAKEHSASASSSAVVSTSDGVHRTVSLAHTAATAYTVQTNNELSIIASGQEAESDCIEVDPGFEVPSLSQIRLSQVEFLTSPMKRWVLSILEAGTAPVGADSRPLPAPKKRKLIQPTLAPLKSHATAAKRSRVDANRKLVKSGRRRPASKAKGPKMRQSNHCYAAVDSKSLFENDVYPLSLFMDENPSADAESRNHVTAFLLVCANERRLGDLVVLLRSIRNRTDRWGDGRVLQPITDQVNDAVEAIEGSRLDMDWI